MTKNTETESTLRKEKKPYEKPVVETEEVLERQVLGTGELVGNPMCA